MADRDLDVVVFGATSVTGRRVAAYLGRRALETGASWAAVARNPERLRDVLAQEEVDPPEALVADVGDPGSLAAMAARARVVLNLVGPYTRNGRPVIAACVEGGAHYVDLTGEIPFVRRTIGEFHDSAGRAGVKVVQVCGFEALPPDLGVLLAREAARDRFAEELVDVDLAVRLLRRPGGIPRYSDFISGGTSQSLAEAVGDDDAACITDSACLVPDPARAEQVRAMSPIEVRPRRNARGAVIAPMAPAAFINPAVIQRTAALAPNPPPPFRYREGVAIPGSAPTLPFRFAAAGMLSGFQAGAAGIAGAGTGIRRRLSRGLSAVLPESGAGPRPGHLEDWLWRMDLVATTGSGRTIEVGIEAEGHPGYLATARLMGEAGLLLAEPGATPDGAGCLTPALAIGTASTDRFQIAGLRFTEPATED